MLALDALMGGCFYLWRVTGLDGARNVLLLIGWPLAICFLLVGMLSDVKDTPRESALREVYGTLSNFVIVCAFAWFGDRWLAACWLIGFVLLRARLHAARMKEAA
ncbi:hypothetical protein [Burkholderia sp. JKS000303]|uniref:hypothetical protein n=1 Tax=Burkholderia sp. JKS000303 TaxID=1938747 RepID=UPI0011815BFD|nr:hypothetical protein [Burkholderia sp. JKS000303]